MSTRGLYGIRYENIDKTSYNHSDSYPAWLGAKMIRFCQDTPRKEMLSLFTSITLVDQNVEPTLNDLKDLYNANIIEDEYIKYRKDWYSAIRSIQGNLDILNKIAKKSNQAWMTDDHDFIKDSLFCEYAYIINLDTNSLEFWIGFQNQPDSKNRYGTEKNHDGYYPCKLIAEIPIDELYNKSKDQDDSTKNKINTYYVNILEQIENCIREKEGEI